MTTDAEINAVADMYNTRLDSVTSAKRKAATAEVMRLELMTDHGATSSKYRRIWTDIVAAVELEKQTAEEQRLLALAATVRARRG